MSVYDPLEPVGEPDDQSPPERRAGALRRLLRKPLGISALLVLASLVLLGLLEPVLATHPTNFSSLQHVNAPPGTAQWPLGGDGSGRDIWSRSLAALNVSVMSAVIGTMVAVVLGTVFGLLAGYVGKRTDATLSWVFNLLMTFPALVLVIVVTPLTGGSYKWMMAVLGFFLAPGVFRLVRNLVVGVRNELYVDAARVSGLSTARILSRHVFYVIRGPVIISAAFLASTAISVQAGLSFLGVGSNQTPSFGAMTNDALRNIYSHPVQLVWPSMFLALLTGSLILLGNAYRDVLAGPQAVVRRPRRRKAMNNVARRPSPGPEEASGPTDADTVLRVRDLRVRYPQPDGTWRAVVDGISFDVRPGEVVGLVGESGSGKSQTAFSVLGLLPEEADMSATELDLAGVSLTAPGRRGLRELRGSTISYVPQEPMSNLDPSYTVGSQLVEGLRRSMSRREAKARSLELLGRVGIPDPVRTFGSYPHQISGGMAQRVLIAAAVATRPKLLIADEPTTALDVMVQAEILDLLRELQAELGMSMLLVTHNFGVVADLCDRVVVMRNGEFIEEGDVRSIFHRPKHPYTRQLIESILDEETVRADPAAALAGEESR